MNIQSKRATWVTVLLLVMASVAMAQTATPKAKATVSQESVKKYMQGLASDEMRGRGSATADELAAAKSFLKGSYALSLDTSAKIAAQLTQIQLDNLGIDYVQRRGALIDAVTIADAKRVAKRLYSGGMLVTVAGRPKGLTSSGTE